MNLIKSVKDYISEVLTITDYGSDSKNIINKYKSNFLELKEENPSLLSYYDIIEKKLTNSSDYKFYYRGHYNKEKYTLIPSVFRGKNWWREDYYYHEMIVRCADHFQNSTHLDKLVRMQHYGCPTRLMDITSNPLTALYFACNNFDCEKCNNSDSGEVIIFAVPTKEISYFDSDKALMLSCLAKFSAEEKVKILKEIKKNNKEFSKDTSGSKYNDESIEKLHHEISTEVPSFKRQIVPNDLITPIFVQPEKTNERIVKQDGAFILSGLSKNEKEAIEKTEALCYTKLTICNQAEIKKELEALGINQATLFPEVDMVAEYLKYTVKNKK